MDKSKFKDDNGRYIVQGLFIEDRYNTDLSVYTFDGKDKTYKGKVYPSLKRLYLEEGDPEEYLFAQKYLFDWPHWQRLCRNSIISKHVEEWRTELNLSLRSEGIATLIDLAINDKSYQAAKWLADEGWIKKTRGRPSKEEVDGERVRQALADKEFEGDYNILKLHKGKN